MPRRLVAASGKTYTVSLEDEPPAGGRFCAIMLGRVLDELTDRPPVGEIIIESEALHAVPRLASDGLIGLVGIPQQVLPKLYAQGYTIELKVKAPGYLPYEATVSLAMDPEFPQQFTPPPAMEMHLHRQPVVISGRTIQRQGTKTSPLPGATIEVTGIWRKPPPADQLVPAESPLLVSLRPPLYSARQMNTALNHRDLPVIAADARSLFDDVGEGANSIRVSNRQNLTPGDILFIDVFRPEMAEYLAIKEITGASTATQPAVLTLDYPLANFHRRGALIQKVNPQASGGIKHFTQEALPGDTCIFLNNVTGLKTGDQVGVTGGLNPDEYHALSRFSAISDVDGYYQLPPLSRVAQLEVQALHGGQVTPLMTFRPNYGLRENRLDFFFS
jgi:hypothetical protein